MGSPVRWASRSTAVHFALNSETTMVFIDDDVDMVR
jgi:hypothetical protein